MIKSILIANRGEIACRVIRTCKKLGIKSISIYSEVDADLPHVKLADQAISIGVGSLAETYLNMDKIIKIAKDNKAEAIHPGYGFLSENAEFAQKLQKAGVIFIGPSISAIELMGDKKESKIAIEKINGPLIPGYHGDKQDEASLKSEANKIGYPVLIKATAGGGGKGMRIVEKESDFSTSLESAKREAKNAFGDDKVILEKYITNPRHIEVQVMSDTHDNHFHFYERECSIQRRYQKVVEETPSTALTQEVREKICKSAVDIANHINYVGAGTVEFILDEKSNFFFLEMNTRLQVEHPITELVTNSDLVELQIRVASGEKLSLKQSEIKQTGHAIECRLYAEDPDNDFLPSVGVLGYIGPVGLDGIRFDSGFEAGNEVSINFDPMLAKIISYGENRTEAITKMKEALNRYLFCGVRTNRGYLRRILDHADFKSGLTLTSFVVKNAESLKPKELTARQKAKMIASLLYKETNKNNDNTWNKLSNFRNF